MIVRCKLCGRRTRISKDKSDAIRSGRSVTVYCPNKRCENRLGGLVAEQRLQAIVAKLPKTADGVPIVPGMKVWHMNQFGEIAEAEVEIRFYGDPLDIVTEQRCYSTRQKAEQAGEE